MSTLVKTENATFVLADNMPIDGMNASSSCSIDITVKTLLYECGNYFYDISYKYTFSGEDSKHLHPFNDKPDSAAGDIIAKNSMTDEMIRYLMMDAESLGKVSGHVDPSDYRVNIMRALGLFWD